MYALLGLCLALATLLTVNALAACAVVGLWRGLLARATRNWSAGARAQILFALRLAPFAFALLFVAALIVPSYLRYEPEATAEAVSLKLAAFAALSIIGLALALWRGLMAWLTTRRLIADWLRHAEPITLPNVALPAFRVAHKFPVVAVVGALRPRLFVAQQLFAALSHSELSAVLAHERGHLAARDNLKRTLLRACRDVLMIVPAGRTLDRAWAESVEAAADEHAAQAGDDATALDLASALIKIARLIPTGAQPTMPAGAFLIGEFADGNLAWRVERLAQLAGAQINRRTHAHTLSLSFLVCASVLLLVLSLIVGDARVLAVTHAALEYIVGVLR
jgi:Zn-dependent protease with chaperone function